MKLEKNILLGVGLLVLAALIAYGTFLVVARHRFSGSALKIKTVATNCSLPSNAVSANYTATIIAGRDYQSAINGAKSFFSKYGGDIISWSTYNSQYQTGPDVGDSGMVTSTIITGTIPILNAEAFVNDLQAAFSSSDVLESPSYIKTTAAQLTQTCIDDLNNVHQAQAMAEIYTREIPVAVSHYVPASTNTSYYYGNGGSNVDILNQQITNAYQEVISYDDNFSTLLQSIGTMTVGLTINAKDMPASYYPPSPPQPVQVTPTQ